MAPIAGQKNATGPLKSLQKLSTPGRLCWATAVPIAPGEIPIQTNAVAIKNFVPWRTDCPINGVFKPSGIERSSGVTNQDRIDSSAGSLERSGRLREIDDVVVAIQRQVLGRDLDQQVPRALYRKPVGRRQELRKHCAPRRRARRLPPSVRT